MDSNNFEDVFEVSVNDTNNTGNNFVENDIFGTIRDCPNPWDNLENSFNESFDDPFYTITPITKNTSPIICGQETISVLESMTAPTILNSKMTRDIENNIYMDTLKLIQQVEIILCNKKITYEIKKEKTILKN